MTDATAATGGVRVEICLRSAVTGVVEARQDEVLDRVQQLDRNGRIDETEITYWSARVTAPHDGAYNDSGCPDVVTELYEALNETDLSLAPFFREKEIDRDRTTLFLPVVCLLVRREGEIVGVYPATSNGDHQTIQDGLDALGDGGEWANLD